MSLEEGKQTCWWRECDKLGKSSFLNLVNNMLQNHLINSKWKKKCFASVCQDQLMRSAKIYAEMSNQPNLDLKREKTVTPAQKSAEEALLESSKVPPNKTLRFSPHEICGDQRSYKERSD